MIASMNMIWFDRDGNKLLVRVNTQMQVDRPVYGAVCELDSEVTAAVVVKHLSNTLDATMCAIMEQAYNEGWADRSRKARKKTHFDRCVSLGKHVGW